MAQSSPLRASIIPSLGNGFLTSRDYCGNAQIRLPPLLLLTSEKTKKKKTHYTWTTSPAQKDLVTT